MTKYARLDTNTPPNVIGFYDTELHDYVLPPEVERVELSEAEWEHRVTHGSWQWVNGRLTAPPVSPATQARAALQAQIALGVVLTSTVNPSLNGTYALDPVTIAQVGSLARDVGANLGFPGGGESFAYPDLAGNLHGFTEAQFMAFYRALRDRLLLLNAQAAAITRGEAPSWPDNAPIALD